LKPLEFGDQHLYDQASIPNQYRFPIQEARMKFRITLIAVLCLSVGLSCLAAQSTHEPLSYQRPDDFKPFVYKYSTEQLRDKFSARMMKRAEKEWREIEAVNAKGPYKPTYESLSSHPVPEWYMDAKFGIAINMGLHSVPAWDERRKRGMWPDAYGGWMYTHEEHLAHHAEAWGEDLHFDDFFSLYTAENYDPKEYAELIAEVGAKYILPMSKHHDGVAWWDTKWSQRSHVRMGPKRDLLTPLIRAVRRKGIKFFLYCPFEEYAYPLLADDGSLLFRQYDWKKPTIEPFADRFRRRVSGYIPVKNYYDHYMTPIIKEMIDRFNPDGMWLDGEFIPTDKEIHSRELVAYMYNRNHGRKEFCVNDRLGRGSRKKLGDFLTNEYRAIKISERYWEAIRGIGQCYAYHHQDTAETLLSSEELVHMFVNIVASNGNLLLIIGPDRTGRISDIQMTRLKALGRWLKANGEAIYGTRVLAPHNKDDVFYTQSKDGRFAYAICTQWPGEKLLLPDLRAEPGASIQMLGVKEPLHWRQDEKGLVISIPKSLADPANRPCKYAWAVRVPN
jgi:alpha-L-fucosidase